ncbi:MAG: hypothetical protein PHV82_01325 [Victivallaceae bacterium]|nr:hypothetical protein [Victivallaceae bacterium]
MIYKFVFKKLYLSLTVVFNIHLAQLDVEHIKCQRIRCQEIKYQTIKLMQKKCPVMGGKINPKLYYQYKDQKIYVYCKGYIATIKKNPEIYLKKIQKQIVAASKKLQGKNLFENS